MRFHLGPIPISPEFVPVSPWKALRELSPWLGNLLSLPIGVVAAAIAGGLWFVVTPLRGVPTVSVPGFLLSFVGIVIVHELIHVLTHPMAGLSSHSIVGYWPSIGFYANYDNELSRNRLVAILLMPLLLISIVPLLIAAIAHLASGWAAFVSGFNAFLSCADILEASLILLQIPANRIVRFHGWRIYWKDLLSV